MISTSMNRDKQSIRSSVSGQEKIRMIALFFVSGQE
jgi:hypothetical protein